MTNPVEVQDGEPFGKVSALGLRKLYQLVTKANCSRWTCRPSSFFLGMYL